MSKVCTICGESKALNQFWRQCNGALGLQSRCKDCQRQIMAAIRARPEYQQRSKARYRENRGEHAAKGRRNHLLRKFGLTISQYATMLAKQGGGCAICAYEPVFDRLAVDHDHDTGKVRALLCDRCNRLIGLAGESYDVLRNASIYVNAHQRPLDPPVPRSGRSSIPDELVPAEVA